MGIGWALSGLQSLMKIVGLGLATEGLVHVPTARRVPGAATLRQRAPNEVLTNGVESSVS